MVSADTDKCKKEIRKLRNLLESAPDAIVILNEDHKIEIVNAQTEKIFGYHRDELIGKEIGVLIPASCREKHKHHEKMFEADPRPREMGSAIEILAVRKNGEQFPVEVSLSPVKTEKGTWVSSAIRDVTDKKAMQNMILKLNSQLEAKVSDRTKELEESMKELEGFSYSVSHDLRTPLRAINGYAKMLEEDHHNVVSEEGMRLINLIKKNTVSMGLLIDSLLSFSRLGRKDTLATCVDMTEICKDVVHEVTEFCPNNVRIKVAQLHPVIADKTMIRQVFMNLISNAVKFSTKKENGLIEIISRENEQDIIFCIKDNGAGFDMAYAGKLFNVFQRLHSANEFEGSGVGLAIVKRVILKHNGNVWAEGKENEGACFYFSLPRSHCNEQNYERE